MSQLFIRSILAIVGAAATAVTANAQVLISGYMANPAGTDSPYEYVQLVATTDINFSLTPMAVVFANNGTATSSGWVAGGSLTYEFSLTSGTVTAGQIFYVGGSGQLIDGSASTDISGQTWIRTINTGTTGGDLFGTAASAGIVGNGGSNADGIGIFNTTNLTASTAPIDAVFYGQAIGTATNSSGNTYTLPANDLYSGGYLGGSNTNLFFDPGSGAYAQLVGAYDTNSDTWVTVRTANDVALTASSPVSAIISGIQLVPEPGTCALAGLGVTVLLMLRKRNRC